MLRRFAALSLLLLKGGFAAGHILLREPYRRALVKAWRAVAAWSSEAISLSLRIIAPS
jgi:hypothetical protein